MCIITARDTGHLIMFSPEGYRALTEAAGLVRRGDRSVLTVTGPDRLTWLQGLLTNDVLSLPIGGICDAAYLTPQGRMITDMRVVHAADRTLLEVPGSLAESLHKRLEGLLFSEDAQIANTSTSVVVVDIHGPLAPTVVVGEPVLRDDAYELPGFSAFLPGGDVSAFAQRVCARGAIETTLETLDVVRIEAGRPVFLVDMDEHTIPLEAGLERRAISFSKGCYVGQEIIVRVTQRGGGRVARKLVGLRFQSPELPKPKDVIKVGGREIGWVTSAARSPRLGIPIALGYVHRDFTQAGTEVMVSTVSAELGAQVSELPFVSLAPGLQKSRL
jgi:folate-binding protein YgfZ